jgi:hypothetical protein
MMLETGKETRHPRGVSCAAAVVALLSLGLCSNPASAQSAAEKNASSHSAQAAKKSAGPQAGQSTFSTAADASQALFIAIQHDDQDTLLKVLGVNGKDIISSGDEAEDKTDRDQFVQKYKEMHRLVMEPDGTTTLYIGAENWPTPIPLVRRGDAWYFDTAAGKQEILYRRIGKNELSAIQVSRELVDAQKEYHAQPRDGQADRQYAQKFSSDPGKHNGLYWDKSSETDSSPIGPLVAVAAREKVGQADQDIKPFQGYYFRILTCQGAKAAGGAKSYIADGKMTRGFAFVAYPAEYRSSGVMTFVVNQDGIVYEKDLGPKTGEVAKAMKEYDPDATWRKAD